jgi:hypothetical protein
MIHAAVTRNRRSSLLAMALLAVLVLLGAGALAVYAAGGKPDFAIAASPASQTVEQGQAATYSVSVSRANGFTGAVTLAASNLPSGASATWKLPDGTASNVIPSSGSAATLTVRTAASTPAGSAYPVITATSGNLSHSIALTLVVQSAARPTFTVSSLPSTQNVLQGDSTSYAVTVRRDSGFTGAVALSVSGLPNGAGAAWTPSATVAPGATTATLTVTTDAKTPAGASNLVIAGTAPIGGSPVVRFATVSLVVEETRDLRMNGDLGGRLFPGARVPLDVTFTNPYKTALKVTSLSVSVAEGTSRSGCSGTRNFRVTPFSGGYPLVVPPGTSQLSSLVTASSRWPQVEMLDLPVDQNACQGVRLALHYDASATK